MTVSVFAPASIGNVTVGFDVLGLAVQPVDGSLLGDVVSVEASDSDRLDVIGNFANKLPSEPSDNIVWHCLQLFNQALAEQKAAQKAAQGHTIQSVRLTLDKKMPVGSGLGSSACSVVAALEALNAFYDKPFSPEQMLAMMGQMEAQISGSLHYDNVAPCYFGGLQLMIADPAIITRTLPSFEDCYFVMAYPGIEVSTKAAREVLPNEYSKADAIAFGQTLAGFVDACYRQDKQQAFGHFKDVLAEPYRESLLPGFVEAKAHLQSAGCLAVGISGSGPTLFAVTDDKALADNAATWLQENYLSTELGFVHVCKADTQGARCL
ncbi:homoserine kinase [Thalassotalea euphylliae]|uniref:Homoserine kinase n=1 Tax=Thalassotalea euphylliae TaxID=1655234 RepID=A0A3E0UC37_9GAMM|nr:homoserine kinase [Thalassotalea euphylliae]REL34568.1 homoserine kinase [Thalassotalea euphylliae]